MTAKLLLSFLALTKSALTTSTQTSEPAIAPQLSFVPSIHGDDYHDFVRAQANDSVCTTLIAV